MFLKKERNNLIGLKVFTQSALYLGVVVFVKTDPNSGDLNKIYAKKRFFFFPIGRALIIDRSQIVEISDKKIIVEDSVSKISSENIVYEAETA